MSASALAHEAVRRSRTTARPAGRRPGRGALLRGVRRTAGRRTGRDRGAHPAEAEDRPPASKIDLGRRRPPVSDRGRRRPRNEDAVWHGRATGIGRWPWCATGWPRPSTPTGPPRPPPNRQGGCSTSCSGPDDGRPRPGAPRIVRPGVRGGPGLGVRTDRRPGDRRRAVPLHHPGGRAWPTPGAPGRGRRSATAGPTGWPRPRIDHGYSPWTTPGPRSRSPAASIHSRPSPIPRPTPSPDGSAPAPTRSTSRSPSLDVTEPGLLVLCTDGLWNYFEARSAWPDRPSGRRPAPSGSPVTWCGRPCGPEAGQHHRGRPARRHPGRRSSDRRPTPKSEQR